MTGDIFSCYLHILIYGDCCLQTFLFLRMVPMASVIEGCDSETLAVLAASLHFGTH